LDTQHFTAVVLDLGEKMLKCGAEIYRVEDTITRICRAYNAECVDVFTLTSVIILTVRMKDEAPCTQIKRVQDYNTDLEYLNSLNDFSRTVCRDTPDVDRLEVLLKQIEKRPYPKRIRFCTHALISASFSLFAGGSLTDAAVSASIGVLLAAASTFMGRIKINPIFAVFCSSAFCGIIAAALFSIGIGDAIDKIIIGNIMILVPGLAITNSIRDMINGDIVSGLMRLAESLFIAVAIAAGFALALMPFGL
jgi:uncharacterized membrane protein YjjP (DUF1212 family)